MFGVSLERGREIFYLIWAFVLAALLTTRNLLDSREGRAIRALKGGRVMAESMGVNTWASRMIVFVLAAMMACASGWLYAHMQRFVNPTPFFVARWHRVSVHGGHRRRELRVGRHPWIVGDHRVEPVVARLAAADRRPGGNYETIVFGVLMIVILQRAPEGLWPALTRRLSGRSAPARFDRSLTLSQQPPIARGETLLDVREVTKRFGGLVAVDRMNLTVRAGEIVALIGPNGAGKTTMFNVISGVLDATSGAVSLRGRDVTKSESRDIAKLGLSRTFQHVRLLPQMSVLDNVAIGAHRRAHPGLLIGVITGAWRLDRRGEASLLGESARQLERVGLGEHINDEAGSLPLGQAAHARDRASAGVRSEASAARRAGGRLALPRKALARRAAAQAARRRARRAAGRARHGFRDDAR